jgi:ATP-dependent Lhr-like helicase
MSNKETVMPFDMLSEPIRRYIRDKGWEELRPIQEAAITRILTTENNYILASRTASGKTEAAFLPVLSKANFKEDGVQVLYISPLIALINDQFQRVEDLCRNLDVKVTKWHGEANRTLKVKLVRQPEGIVLITPESLEAMFVNAPYNVKALFSNLKFVVIDEIHSFIGTDRGTQLKSILSRLQEVNKNKYTVVGLSATIGDYEEAKRFTGDEANTKVLRDKTAKEIEVAFRYFGADTTELSLDLVKDLYLQTKDHKVLIFPNSRGRAEEIAVKLKKISERVNGHPNYFSHHSSVDKEVREYVEHFAKNNQRNNFCISCTSTLELGIDIGTVDKVVQVDATHSIASLIQRVGRSGRREGETSSLILYATNKWSFLQSLACWLLFREEFIEPAHTSEKQYDILLHQLLSIVKETGGCSRKALLDKLNRNFAFKAINPGEAEEIIDELISAGFLELLGNELIVGVEGEKIVNSKDFYSVFKSEPNFKVVNAGTKIGEIPLTPQVVVGENILLAALIWKIKDIDYHSHRIEVAPAKDGRKPLFFGGAGMVHSRVRERMLQIVLEDTIYPGLDSASTDALLELRSKFKHFAIKNRGFDRPVLVDGNKTRLFTFTGSKINRSIHFLLKRAGIECMLIDEQSAFEFEASPGMLPTIIQNTLVLFPDLDFHLENEILVNPTLLDFSKWGLYLPMEYKCRLIKEKYFDFEGAESFLRELRIIVK